MDKLYILQLICFLMMLVNAMILIVGRFHIQWKNKRYERSRLMIIAGMLGLAMQYLAQMVFRIRATDEEMGAIFNILVYTPSFSAITMGIYNIVATHTRRRRMVATHAFLYAAIIAVFTGAAIYYGSMDIHDWIYVMLLLYLLSVIYSIYINIHEMRRRQQLLEALSANDMLPYVRYSHASLAILFFAALSVPFCILFTPLLYVIGPLALFATLFFSLTFVALGFSYRPSEELLDDIDESGVARSLIDNAPFESGNAASDKDRIASPFSEERSEIIRQRLNKWVEEGGYKDSSANIQTLSQATDIPKEELNAYFRLYDGGTFRLWLSDLRFKAVQEMMLRYPNYSNDYISAECGFSARTYLYRIFKERLGMTPTEWRDTIIHG